MTTKDEKKLLFWYEKEEGIYYIDVQCRELNCKNSYRIFIKYIPAQEGQHNECWMFWDTSTPSIHTILWECNSLEEVIEEINLRLDAIGLIPQVYFSSSMGVF